MTAKWSQNGWLPSLVVAAGVGCSFLFWYYLYFYLDNYMNLVEAMSSYVPWLALACGLWVSILLGVVVHITQLAHQRAQRLSEANANIQKEISERMAVEASKQKLEVALLQGQKLQAMGTLAGGIAHDFNNILYAIIGYAGMCREDIDKTSITYTNLGKVLEASHRGQELVARILTFSRRQHHHFEIIDLRSNIEAALSLLRPTIPASVIIHFEAENHAMIVGNQTQLHQVLVNLINNSVDAMDGEGTIHIHLDNINANDPILKQFPGTHLQPYCKIEIIDTGHGMDQSTAERIFEPFFTTKEVGKGTGLGLSIVHTIIKEHQGEITVDSQLGHGTRFIILLPAHL